MKPLARYIPREERGNVDWEEMFDLIGLMLRYDPTRRLALRYSFSKSSFLEKLPKVSWGMGFHMKYINFPQRMHGAPISEEVQAAWGVAQHQQLCPPLIRLSLVVLVGPTPPSTCITVIYFAQSAIFSGQGEVFRNVKTMARDCFPFSHSQEMMMRTCALMDSSVLVPTLINFEQDCCFHFSSIMCWLFSNAFNMCAFRILAQLVAA